MREIPTPDNQASLITGLGSLGVAIVAVIVLAVMAEGDGDRAGRPGDPIAGAPGNGIDLNGVPDVARRKREFVRRVLPLIDRENERIAADRRLALKDPPARLYARYRIKPGNRAALIERVDVIPRALALAQAAIESGWGTSRFARQGNNLYGERTYSRRAKGIAPRDATGFKVTAFKSAAASVRSYMHNLNTHAAYRRFREARAHVRKTRAPTSMELAAYLEAYSEKREVYVRTIRRVIRDNRLERLDHPRLARR